MEWLPPVKAKLKSDSLTLFSVPPPAGGAVLAAILNIMEENDWREKGWAKEPLFYHRLVESFKMAFAARSNLGDPFDDEITDFIRFVVAQSDL